MTIVIILTAVLVASYIGIAFINIMSFTYHRGFEIWAKCHEYYAYVLACIVPWILEYNIFDSLLLALLYAALSAPAITVVALAIAALSNFLHNLFTK